MTLPMPNPTDLQREGERMHALARSMFGWHRAITGAGLRRTLQRIGREIPLELSEVPSGTRVLDFQAPLEWEIRDAYVADSSGGRVIDYRQSNLHVVSYSQPVRRSMSWIELEPHLHSLPEHPDWIPYRTAILTEPWGFCLRHRDRQRLAARSGNEQYEVCIDAEHRPGSLTYGECFLPGTTGEEVLLSAHACHPSLANDNLSAMVVAVALAQDIARWPRRRYGYRFLFAPATIGALAWLSRNAARVPRIRHGLVLAQLGDPGDFTYKRSRRHQAPIDHAVIRVLRERGRPFQLRDFEPWGYDERQFCSPGFNLPMGRLTRSPDGQYPQYHTSADDLDLITPAALAGSLECCLQVLRLLETEPVYVRTDPRGEPQLGPRGLYAGYGRGGIEPAFQQAVLWLLNLADGEQNLAVIAERSGVDLRQLHEAARVLLEHEVIREVAPPAAAPAAPVPANVPETAAAETT